MVILHIHAKPNIEFGLVLKQGIFLKIFIELKNKLFWVVQLENLTTLDVKTVPIKR